MSTATINATELFTDLDETTSELLELITSVSSAKN